MPSERGNLLRALGETRDVFTIQKYLDMTLNQVFGKKNDVTLNPEPDGGARPGCANGVGCGCFKSCRFESFL